MERNYLKRQLSLRLVIYTAIAILLYGAAAQYHTAVAGLATKQKQPVNVLVMSNPPLFIVYNPQFKKAIVNNIPFNKKGYETQEIISKANLQQEQVIIININRTQRTVFWDKFNDDLRNWRKKPYLIFKYIYAYFDMLYKKQIGISFGDYLLIGLELAKLQPSDFAVQNPLAEKVRKGKKQKAAPLTITTEIKPDIKTQKPLEIEVLNASGKKGLAAQVTKLLREMANEDIINVDVIESKNYNEFLDNTRIIDHTSGTRILEIKQTIYQLGLDTSPINRQEDKNAIADVKIILGKDFVLPKQPK